MLKKVKFLPGVADNYIDMAIQVNTKFRIVNSHASLEFLTGDRNRTMSPASTEQAIGLRDRNAATAFAKSMGLSLQEHVVRNQTAMLMLSFADEGSPSVQLIAATTQSEEIPAGSGLINCLLPPTDDLQAAETHFKRCQALMGRIFDKLQAHSFACITGHTHSDPPHYLYSRGFRFFLGPDPGKLYSTISATLAKYCKLYEHLGSLPREEEYRAARMQTATEIHSMYHAHCDGQLMPHSMLMDIKPQSAESLLVDLR